LSVTATANNQLSGTNLGYDAAGNMTANGLDSGFQYDAAGQLVTANTINGYSYDAEGRRIGKNSKTYWYGLESEPLSEADTKGNFTDEYVFFGGRRVAHITVSSGEVDYYIEDLLGTSRALVVAGATSPCYDADFYPFGGERSYTNTCAQNYKFEGKERDPETGFDDFGGRYYASNIGRWMAADWSAVPAPVPYANLSNPQSLNLYAMVRDNPETFSDLDGHIDSGVDLNGQDISAGYAGNSNWADSLEHTTLLSPGFSSVDNTAGEYYQREEEEEETKRRELEPNTDQQDEPKKVDQAQTQTPATTNTAHPDFSHISFLKIASDFSASAGDVLSLGTTYLARKYIFDSDKVVNKGGGAYLIGTLTGTAIGAALGKEIASRPNTTQIKIAVHEAHHTFEGLGKLAHIQINVWKAGVSGSGWALRIPLPW
jgi:RHS repeat-associated protein